MHLTVRMAWHDNNWDGKVCCNPEGNTYCTGNHSLLSGRMEKRKNVITEQKFKGQYVDGNFQPENVPPCYWSINAFGSRTIEIKHHHAFKQLKATIDDTVEPYSVFTWPFKLSFVHTENSFRRHGNYWPDLPQRINDFSNKFKKDESVVFFYANYDNPVSADDMKYLLLGCSVIDKVHPVKDFEIPKRELDFIGKGKSGNPMKNFPLMNWAIQVTHHNDKSVLLPYREYIKYIEEFPEEYELLNDIKVVIDEPSLVRGFKYVAMDIEDDKCLILLYKIRKAIFEIREHNHQVIHHNLDEEESRINDLIKMVWEKRGIYPSLSKLLKYFLRHDTVKLSDSIKILLSPKFDLIMLFEQLLKGEDIHELEDFTDDIDDLLANPKFKRKFKAYLKLSLFNLTDYQIKRIIEECDETIIIGLENNPYLIYENYIPQLSVDHLDIPDLMEESIDVYKIDIGMIPDAGFVKRHRKIQNLHESSPERIRSIIIEYLWGLEGPGHCYDNLRHIIKTISEYPLIFHTESLIDENGIFNLEKEYKSHFQERLHIETVGEEKYVYLKEILRAELRISDTIKKFLLRDSHPDPGIDYNKHIEISIAFLKKKIKDFDINQFKIEREQLYENVFKNSFFLLTGKPGSGKTFETSHVIKHLNDLKEGLTILAPTGKAALRVSENIKRNTGLDIKAITIDRFIFENGFYWVYEDWDRLYNLPENEKVTVMNLIIDESSMVDLQKLYILFSIIKLDENYPKRVIFVGDENQLPPIGFGKPFHDIINFVATNESLFKKHYIHLTTNCRQENDLNILKLAEAFSDKSRYYEESFELLHKKGKVSKGLYVYPWKFKSDLEGLLKESINNLLDDELNEENLNIGQNIDKAESGDLKYKLSLRKDSLVKAIKENDKIKKFNLLLGLYDNGYVPIIDNDFRKLINLERLQLLTPYRSGYFGVLGLNNLIQSEFRDTSFKDPQKQFYHADKIIRINNYYLGYGRRKQLILSNGSIGILNNHKSEPRYYFRDADSILYRIDDEENFDLAYSITIHKSQGSDFTIVLLIIPNRFNLLTRELIYTALTRSKQKLILFLYDAPENILVKCNALSDLLTRQTSLFEKPEDKRLKYYPRKGEKPVRSKAEYIIHKALQRSNLPFEYEHELKFKDFKYPIHPDFTIKLEDNRVVYWEHLGMLDTRKYFNDWAKRKEDYKRSDLIDVLVTTDDMNGIADEYVEKVIDDIRNNRLINTVDNKFSIHHYPLYPK